VAYPSTVRAIEDRLGAIADRFPALCTRTVLPNRTHEGRSVSYVRVAAGAGIPVLFTGGAHAREWVPPDALLTLLERLLEAQSSAAAFEVPAFTDARPGRQIVYPAASLPAETVQRIVDRLELYVLPLINPDGRAYSQASPANALWRKNRRPPPAGSSCVGVDLNRNHDVAWDFERYYSRAGAQVVSASKDPCDAQVYIGPAAASEPETRNVAALMAQIGVAFYVDVHSFSRKLLYPWGMDDDQSRDPSQNYRNPDFDGRRDGGPGGPYGEFIPQGLLARHQQLGGAMHDAILAAAGSDPSSRGRSDYAVEPSLALYPTTGTASDYACTLQFVPTPRPDGVISFTLECGSDADGEGGFQPLPAIYPKIEREVHLALMALLTGAAGA
jgi:murein tripeptide amidase MpaA